MNLIIIAVILVLLFLLLRRILDTVTLRNMKIFFIISIYCADPYNPSHCVHPVQKLKE
jgi:hypothetical protein